MKRLLIFSILIAICIAVYDSAKTEIPAKSGFLPTKDSIAGTDTFKIVAVGDVMAGTSYPDSSFLPEFPAARLFAPLRSVLRSGDVTFSNLEGVLTDDLSQVKDCFTEGRCYYFAMPADYAKIFQSAGFNLMSVANNHTNDFGYSGRKSTRKSLRAAGIHFAGMLEMPFDTFSIKGLKIGFCAFSPNAGMTNVKNIQRAGKLVHLLDSMCNIVIVSFHAGAEGPDERHVTRETEYYIDENRGNVYEFAHCMIDAGADVLLGHGPHVTRAVELYRDRFIAYSLGNFCTFSRISVAGRCGQAPLLQLSVDKNGRFLKGRIIPVMQRKGQPPVIDSTYRAVQQIQKLTKADFPEMERVLQINTNGYIYRIPTESAITAKVTTTPASGT